MIFINNTFETFTPTRSGALATVIWECCRVAASQGKTPRVLSRRDAEGSFDWPALSFVDPPQMPTTKVSTLLWRAERNVTGWRHLRHRDYARRVVRAIGALDAARDTLILFNEPETAVLLRRAFPAARIVHWFQNQLSCKAAFRRQYAAAVNVTLGVSDFTSRWVELYYGLQVGAAKTVYNGVDLGLFRPAERPSPGPPVIGFVGRTGIEKGPDLLLEAALRLRRRGHDFRLRLVGSNHWDRFELDDYQRRLVSLVEELRSSGVNVDCPGHVGRASLPGEIRKSHVHVIPARWDEPFGMTTLEGMATGLGIVASRTGGTPEVLGDAGLYFDRESVDGLTDQLEILVSDTAQRERLGVLSRNRAMSFSWTRVWETLIAAIA